MARGGRTAQERKLNNVLDLRQAREALPENERESVDRVLGDLREELGTTISKTNAADVLGVSTQALDKWIEKGVLRTRQAPNGRRQIPLTDLEELAEEVRALRELGKKRGVIAEALRRLSEEESNVELEADADIKKSLRDAGRGKLDKVTLPDGWSEED